MNIIESIKNRPLLFGSVLVGGVVLLLMLRASGGSSVESAPSYGDVGTGDAVQGMMIQAQRDISIAGIQGQMAADQTAAALKAAELDYDYKNNAAQIGGNISLAQIDATLKTLMNRDTLQANVAINAEDEATTRANINANASLESMKALSGAMVSQAQINAGVLGQYIQANKKECGLMGKIFGC